MPTLYTHYKFGIDVLNKLEKNQKEEIINNIEYYNMFNQGFDNLYYYFKKWAYYRNFGIKAHKKNIDKFFKNIFKYIKENNLENNSELTNIIYGFINHYTIDTIIHPFINYQVSNLDIPHSKIEFMYDYYLISNENKKWQNKIYKTIIPKLKFSKELKELINYTFYNTYKEENIGKIFNKSHNISYFIHRYFIKDFRNIKTKLYKIIDFLLPKNSIKFHKNTFNKDCDIRILNYDKNTWYRPNNKNETYNYSLEELYNISLNICVYLNKLAYQILNNEKNIEELISLINKINLKNIQEFPLQ